MPRFYIEDPLFQGQTLQLSDATVRHIQALRLRDAGGLWLDVPRARVDVGLSVFPPGISLDLRLEHPSLYRLPQLPPSPDEPSPPLAETLAAHQVSVHSGVNALKLLRRLSWAASSSG